MSNAPLPMFPLGSVLLPGGVLPLHVFEPRYQALVRDCVANGQAFGVVLIARGSEVGGGDERTMVGTRAQLVQVVRLDGGRYALLCIGTERFRVLEWLEDAPYPRALVEDWPDAWPDSGFDDSPPAGGVGAHRAQWWDADGTPSAEQLHLVTRVRRLAALALELGDNVLDPGSTLAEEPVRRSYELVGLAPLSSTDRFLLLAVDGPRARLDRLSGLLDDVETMLLLRLAEGQSSPDPPEAW